MQSDAENLAAVLTPPGSGAIAVIRVIGPKVESFLAAHFSRHAVAGRCVHGDLRDASGQTLDDVVVVRLLGSYAADLNVHGGPWVVEAVRQLLEREGFTLVRELPLEALDGNDTFEQEMLAALPLARTEAGIRMLLAQPQAWRTLLESNPAPEQRRAMAEDRTLDRMLHPAHVAIVGIPNVGKSTLANALFGHQRSITADMPGTTRDWVGEFADVDGVPIMLLDTPGVRESDDAIEQSAIALSREVIAEADLVMVVLDPTQPSAEQERLVEAFGNVLRILNKADLAKGEFAADVRTVATTGAGIAELRQAILARLGCSDLAATRSRCWTARQRALLAE